MTEWSASMLRTATTVLSRPANQPNLNYQCLRWSVVLLDFIMVTSWGVDHVQKYFLQHLPKFFLSVTAEIKMAMLASIIWRQEESKGWRGGHHRMELLKNRNKKLKPNVRQPTVWPKYSGNVTTVLLGWLAQRPQRSVVLGRIHQAYGLLSFFQ